MPGFVNAVVALAWVFAAVGSAHALDEPPGSAAAAGQNVQALRIDLIALPRELEIPSRFSLALRIVNGASTNVLMKSFELRALEEPGGLRIKDGCKLEAERYIPAASSATVICQVQSDGFDDSVAGFVRAMFGSWSLLTLQPGEYRMVGTVVVQTDEQVNVSANATVPVKIRPTVWQICLGAAFGALLLVVFAFSSARIQALLAVRERLAGSSGLRRWVVEPLLLWLGASVSASMFIIMTYRLKDNSAPFTLSVNDFYGGVVVGMFGVFLADKLAEQFFGKPH